MVAKVAESRRHIGWLVAGCEPLGVAKVEVGSSRTGGQDKCRILQVFEAKGEIVDQTART